MYWLLFHILYHLILLPYIFLISLFISTFIFFTHFVLLVISTQALDIIPSLSFSHHHTLYLSYSHNQNLLYHENYYYLICLFTYNHVLRCSRCSRCSFSLSCPYVFHVPSSSLSSSPYPSPYSYVLPLAY